MRTINGAYHLEKDQVRSLCHTTHGNTFHIGLRQTFFLNLEILDANRECPYHSQGGEAS